MISKIKFYLLKRKLKKYIELGNNSSIGYRNIQVKTDCRISVGRDSMIGATISFDKENANISIGDRTFIGNSKLICAEKIVIGNDILIAWGCTIVDHNSHSIYWEDRKNDVINWKKGIKNWDNVVVKPIIIEDKAWIGFDVTILKGVRIGEGAVVAARSVVTKDVAPWTVVAGNPAKVIKTINANE